MYTEKVPAGREEDSRPDFSKECVKISVGYCENCTTNLDGLKKLLSVKFGQFFDNFFQLCLCV